MNRSATKLLLAFCLCFSDCAFAERGLAQEANKPFVKSKITQATDLPVFTYRTPETVAELVTNDANFIPFASSLRSDIESILRDFEIADNATLVKLHSTLSELDLLEGNEEQFLDRRKLIQQLNVKTDSNAYSMEDVINMAIIQTRQKPGIDAGDEFDGELQRQALDLLNHYDWTKSARLIRRDSRMFDLFSESFVIGAIGNTLEAEARKNKGAIQLGNASRAVSLRVLLTLIIPSKAAFKQAYNDCMALHQPADGVAEAHRSIWTDRNITLTNEKELTPVVIAVWDTGVDTARFPKQLWMNSGERADRVDNDANGFIDDIHGVGLRNDVDPTDALLSPLDDVGLKNVADEILFMKGMADFQNGKETPAAGIAQKRIDSMASISPDERAALDRAQNILFGYIHGTHVAGIAVEGNPAARLLTIARIFDLNRVGRTPPTVEWSTTYSARAQEISKYFKSSQVRVVNISFGDDQEFFYRLLKENGIVDDDAERRKIAIESFQIYRQALVDLISNCPEILFICSAGNSDDDSSFTGRVPQSLDLPNLIPIGAVDSQGQATGFTSFGKRVWLYANGSNVESFIPGGERIGISGTSQAAPQVSNLAAKLIALDPTLTVSELLGFVKDGSDRTSDGKLLLINPKRSVELLRARIESHKVPMPTKR